MNPKIEEALAKYHIDAEECYGLTAVIRAGGDGVEAAQKKMDAVHEGVDIAPEVVGVYRRIKGKAAGLYRMESEGRQDTEEYGVLERSLQADATLLGGSDPIRNPRRESSGTMVSDRILKKFGGSKGPEPGTK